MKAYVLNNIGRLSYQDVKEPELDDGWGLIKVKAAGICSSDIPRIFEKGTYHFPTIPGHEFSGEVVRLSSEENTNLLGKRVAVFPLIPCGKCTQCKSKRYEMCSDYDYIGSRRDGAFAEYVAAPVWNLLTIGTNITYEEAALMEPLAVAYHAAKKITINTNDRIGIVGTGTIALALCQILGALGYININIIARNDDKQELVKLQGNAEYHTDIENLENGFDAIFECVGTETAIKQAIRYADAGAEIVLIGNPYGDVLLEQNIYWKILRKQLSVKGSWNSSYDGKNRSDWLAIREMLEKKQIDAERIITHRFQQKDMIQALDLMRKHEESYGKIMTIWNEE